MTRPTRQFLALLMVVVTVLAGGLNGYLAFAGHDGTASLAHILSGAHEHHDHGSGHGKTVAAVVDVDHHDNHQCASGENCTHQSQSDHDCPDAHVHCCGSSAVAPCAISLTIISGVREPRFALTSTVPDGNVSYPLLRPPRAYG